jgi:hypothetical protein
MKSTLIIALSALTALPVFAQTPAPTTTPTEPEWRQKGEAIHQVWQSLSPEERQKLKSARETAKNNPAVIEAHKKLVAERKAYGETLSSAMLKSDPSLAPVLEKFKIAKEKKLHK